MITAKVEVDTPRIVGKIIRHSNQIVGRIVPQGQIIKARITNDVDEIPEPYYEVGNEAGGYTIIIGE